MRPETTASLMAASAGLFDFPVFDQVDQHPLKAAAAINPCCQGLLNLDLPVLFPESPGYEERTKSYWSVAAQLTPWCIVQPRTAQEVSSSLVALLADEACGIAVRSGGHTTWAGANNIDEGVTIDLGNMNATTYHAGNSTASIQPGSRWLQVYQTLDALGVTVPGGRAGTVGVAGLVLGGGNSFYSAKKGMVCDNVLAYEMVTYDGEILFVTKDTYPDLFLALKGGGPNFGIVTRFDLTTFETSKLWGGVVVYNKTATDDLVTSMSAFIDNVQNDPASSSIIFWSYLPSVRDIVVIAAFENTDGVVAGPSFDQYLAVPGNISSSMRTTNISDLTHELEQPTDYIDIWFTLTFKNDPRVLQYAITSHAKLVEEMLAQSPDGDFITQCMFQPLPTLFAKHSVAQGGNVLGLDGVADNAVVWLATLAVKGADQEVVGRRIMAAWVDSVEAFAKSVGSDVPWRYMNYADRTQDPLSSYGAQNIEVIQAAAAKYDPAGVFQTRVAGGFKISQLS